MSASNARFLLDDAVAELERLAAADIVAKMRNVEVLNRTLPEDERSQLAKVFERLGNEFAAAAAKLQRIRVDVDVPAYLLLGTESPEFEKRYLKPAARAAFHE